MQQHRFKDRNDLIAVFAYSTHANLGGLFNDKIKICRDFY